MTGRAAPQDLRTGKWPGGGALLVAAHGRGCFWPTAAIGRHVARRALDDTFIHFQYARQLSRGQILAFNAGTLPRRVPRAALHRAPGPGWLVGPAGPPSVDLAWILNAGLHLAAACASSPSAGAGSRRRAAGLHAMGPYLFAGPCSGGPTADGGGALLDDDPARAPRVVRLDDRIRDAVVLEAPALRQPASPSSVRRGC